MDRFILWRADDFARLVFFCGKWNDKEQQRGVREDIPWLQQVESKWDPESENYQTEVVMTKKTNDTVAETGLPGFRLYLG